MNKFFFIITIVLLFLDINYLHAQGTKKKVSKPQPLHTYSPQNVGALVSEDQVQIFGGEIRTKTTNKCIGSKRSPQRWMVWRQLDPYEGSDTCYAIDFNGVIGASGEDIKITSPVNLGISDGDYTIQWWMDWYPDGSGGALFGNSDLTSNPPITHIGYQIHGSSDTPVAQTENQTIIIELREL